MKPLSFFLYAAGCAVVVVMMILTPCATSIRTPVASLNIYDLSRGQKVTALRGHSRPTTAIAVSPDGTLALTANPVPGGTPTPANGGRKEGRRRPEPGCRPGIRPRCRPTANGS